MSEPFSAAATRFIFGAVIFDLNTVRLDHFALNIRTVCWLNKFNSTDFLMELHRI